MNVSVLVATYGDPEWEGLAKTRAADSLIGQSAGEIVLVHEPNGSVASSRNAAAEQANADWLLFLDADDEFAPGYVDAMRAAQAKHPGDKMLFTPAVRQVRKGRSRPPFFFPECDFRTGNWIVIGTMIRKDFFQEVGGFDEHPHGLEDWQLWAKCAKAGATIVKVPNAVYVAHVNAKSKHHALARDRAAYIEAYEKARVSVWG